MASLSPGQIQGQIRSLRKHIRNGARVFALRSADTWPGPEYVDIDGEEFLVAGCASDLHAREILLRAEEENKSAVLLCREGGEQFGEDVLARFAKQRVVQVQAAEMLAVLFGAKEVDPRITGCKPLVEALLKRAPVAGYRPSTTGMLDQQQAWCAFLKELLGLEVDSLSLGQMLEWSADAERARALADLPAPLKSALLDWHTRQSGESVRFMMAAMESGLAEDLIPLGMALGLVFSDGVKGSAEFYAARARLESIFGGQEIDAESGKAWSRASLDVFASWGPDLTAHRPRQALKRLDQFIIDLKLQSVSAASPYAPSGLASRFDHLGTALTQALGKPGLETLTTAAQALRAIAAHALAPTQTERIERAEMALRLLNWLAETTCPGPTAELPERMSFHHRDGGFLDWARQRLRETELSGSLQGAYQKILQRVDAQLAEFEQAFATGLACWTQEGRDTREMIRIEDVLSRVVIPVAKHHPVLLLVLDGMSGAVFRPLLRDIEKLDWAELENAALGLPRPILATLPSVTQFSRRALFLGRLDPGTSGTEQGEFAGHDVLYHASGGALRPRLFLKGELQDASQGGLSGQVKDAISDAKIRVVGVVVNAVDDQLDSSDQVLFNWGIERIRPLAELLKLAAQSKRLVILTSDHGHVLDFGSRQFATGEGEYGDRYRYSPSDVKEGEIRLEGTRVAAATGRNQLVAAWRSDVRYATKKRGYHGGASPQEMVVPLALLNPEGAEVPEGWREIPLYEPAWWRTEPANGGKAAVKKSTRMAHPKKPESPPEPELFVLAPAEEPASWIAALLNSPLYQAQLRHTVRGAPPTALLTAFLRSLESRGGSMMKSALAQAIAQPLFRIDGLVQSIARILNVDGYEVVSIDRASETVSLNLTLLQTQFEIRIR